MITILADGDYGHRLEDADGRNVGSIRNRTIRLGGLASEEEAMAATVDVWRVLDASLARQFPGWPRHQLATDRIRLVHDGAYEWISDGKPLARLVRPRGDETIDTPFAIEFVLPSYSSDGVLISSAQLMAKALEDFVRRRGDAVHRVDDALSSAGAASA